MYRYAARRKGGFYRLKGNDRQAKFFCFCKIGMLHREADNRKIAVNGEVFIGNISEFASTNN